MKRKFDNRLPADTFPLHTAAQDGNTDLVVSLLKHGSNVNQINKDNATPIYLAARQGHLHVIIQLLAMNANYQDIGPNDAEGKLITPFEIAARNGHINVVKLLLSLPLHTDSLQQAMHYSFNNALKCKDREKRNQLFIISDTIKKVLDKKPKPNVLSIQNGLSLRWDQAYKTLFDTQPTSEDKNPNNKNAAIRNALVVMYQLLQNPIHFVPNVQFLSEEMEYHWNKEQNNHSFPKFDINMVDFWSHEGMLWPIPNEKYKGIKKHHLISRVLLDKFKQHGMGDNQYKWTGFIPKTESKKALLNNSFFTENRRTMNGLFHGNVHNIQRVILLLLMESFEIPLTYKTKQNEIKEIESKDVFAALMRNDIFPNGQSKSVLWSNFFDIVEPDSVSFSHPHRMHSLLLTETKFAGFMQDYLLFSFCDQFIHMRKLHNHVYKTNYTNTEICKELGKMMFHVFGGVPEFAIQMDETKNLQQVDTIDGLQGKDRKWNSQAKHYLPLREPVKKYHDLDFDEEIEQLFAFDESDTSPILYCRQPP